MARVLRLALAQIELHRADYSSTSLIREPEGEITPFARMLGAPGVREFRMSVEARYAEHLAVKMLAVLRSCALWGVELLVFPGFSAPPRLLPRLLAAVQETGVRVVAGSHGASREACRWYTELGLDELAWRLYNHPGPLRGTWVSMLMEPTRGPLAVWSGASPAQHEGPLSPPYVLESLDGGQVGLALTSWPPPAGLLVQPTKGLNIVLAHGDVPKVFAPSSWPPGAVVCLVNHSRAGGTAVLTTASSDLASDCRSASLPANTEAVLICDVEPADGAEEASKTCPHQVSIVGVSELAYDYPVASNSVAETHGGGLESSPGDPIVVGDQPLGRLEHGLVRLAEETARLLARYTVADVRGSLVRTAAYFAQRRRGLLPTRSHDAGITLQQDTGLKALPPQYQPLFGRTLELMNLRTMVNDYRCRIVALYGKRAIGKTALVTIGVSQVLPPQWVRVAVRLTEGVGYQRFVLELAEKLGVSAPDSLKPLTNRESHNLTRELLRSFDRLEAAYMVIDDWHYAMDYDGYRDVRFKSFLYQVARRQSYRGNKVIVASRLHLIPPVPSMAQLTLGPLPSDSMRTIVDWAVLASGSVPAKRSIVTAFIARLKGNPLAATLGAHLLGAIPTERLLANINAQKTYQARLPALVLDKIRLNRDEQVLLGYLSVFATPAELEELEAFLGPHVSGLLEYYLDRFVISYDSDCGGYYLSPLVRDYIQAQTSDDVLVSYHRLAADNYRRRLKARGSSVRDQSELVAHLAGCHSLDELQELGGAFVESVTPAVKKLVKSGRYTEALAFFALVERHRPLDYDVKLQIALCRAALHDWEGAEAYRREALRLNPKAWWVHAEYGRALEEHSRSEEAGYHLSRAREMCNALAYSSRQWSLSWVDRLLGSFSERQKQWEQALRYYSRSVEEYPNSTAGKVALARTLWSRSANAGAALDLLNDAAMGDPLDRSVFLLRREILEATNPEHEDPPSNPSRVGER